MSKKVKIKHRQLVDLETGETYDTSVIVHLGGNRDFEMIFYGHLLDIISDLGSKKIKVLSYIIQNRIVGKNVFIGTMREIAKKLDISYQTVFETLKLLEEKEVIKRKTGVIYISPDLIVDGRFKKAIMHEYKEINTEEEIKNYTEKEIKDYA